MAEKMINGKKCIECVYHRIAHLADAEYSESAKQYKGWVNVEDFHEFYDENLQLCGAEYRVNDEFIAILEKKGDENA